MPFWKETTQRIDKGMLMARDPILFYAEVPLYVSELDDNGVSQLTVKVNSFPLSRQSGLKIQATTCALCPLQSPSAIWQRDVWCCYSSHEWQ